MTDHASLTGRRWARFELHQQILMIGNEMHRTSKLLASEDRESRRHGYERILRLTDLTVEVHARPALRPELLRWRDLVAALYIADAVDPAEHNAIFRALLLLQPVAARQIPLLFGNRPLDEPASPARGRTADRT